MEQATRRKAGILLAVLFILAVMIILNWRDLTSGRVDYGRSYNEERIQLKMPIIEDYFRAKYKEGNRNGLQVWFAPDSIEFDALHSGKNYWVSNGQINLEIDYFDFVDSSCVKELARHYYYQTDSLSYVLFHKRHGRTVFVDTLNVLQGDSLLEAWKESIVY